jgi:hypothetical protein
VTGLEFNAIAGLLVPTTLLLTPNYFLGEIAFLLYANVYFICPGDATPGPFII